MAGDRNRMKTLLLISILTLIGNAICKAQLDTILVVRQYFDTARKFHVDEYVNSDVPHLDNPTIVYGFKNPVITKDTLYAGYDNRVYWGYFYNVREWHTTRENQTDRELTNLYINGYYVPEKNEYWVHLYYLDVNKKPIKKSIIVYEPIEINQ